MKKKEQISVRTPVSIDHNLGIIGLVTSSFKSWLYNWPLVLLCILSDLFFIIAVASSVTFAQFKLYTHLEAIMRIAGEATGGILNIYNQTEQVSTGLMGLSANLEFKHHLNVLFNYLGLLILAIFMFWIIFQGISWYFAYRMSTDKRQRFLVFWKNFAIESIPFYLLSVIWIFLSARMLFSSKISIAPLISERAIDILFYMLIAVTWYFSSMCFTLTSESAYSNIKQCFSYGTKKFVKTIQSFAVIVVLFVIVDLLLRIPFIKNDIVMMTLFGIILLLPVLSFARVLLFKTSERYWEKDDQ